MPSQNSWFEILEEAVALEAIFEDSFWVETRSGDVLAVHELPEVYDDKAQKIHLDGVKFCLLVKVQLPASGLILKDGLDGGRSIRHLPPLKLVFKLPTDYPSDALPEFSATAIWQTQEQRARLTERLQSEAEVHLGGPVVYVLASLAESAALEHCQSSETLVLPINETASSGYEPACQSEHTDQKQHSTDLLQILLQYNTRADLESFQMGVWSCPICFEEHSGKDSVQLMPCMHHFCSECISSHIRVHLTDRRVDLLLCPHPGCKARLSRQQLGVLLSNEEVEKWDSLELQATLLGMQDVIFCPRCSTVCIEDSEHTVLCGKCHFAFCSLCLAAYHPGQVCMSTEIKLKILEERKKQLDRAYSKQVADDVRRKEEELLSLSIVEKTSKPCPSCSAMISKTGGCNKMRCSYCGTAFCWTCMAVIDDYDHFRAGGCVVFDDQIVSDMLAQDRHAAHNAWGFGIDRQILAADQRGHARQTRSRRCPYCGLLNYKQGNLNSLTCWACNGRHCYLCRQRLRKGDGATHYRPTSQCKQHSDD